MKHFVFGKTINYIIGDKACQWLAAGRWFSPGTLVSSTNKTDHHDITEILWKVALNTITLTLKLYYGNKMCEGIIKFKAK
jgi:hypothetical protein